MNDEQRHYPPDKSIVICWVLLAPVAVSHPWTVGLLIALGVLALDYFAVLCERKVAERQAELKAIHRTTLEG